MQQSFWLPRFDQFKSFDTVSLLAPSRFQSHNRYEELKQRVLDPTAECQKPTEKQDYATRSVKIFADALNISFQQNFTEQHYSCFDKQLQKYMEHQQNTFGSLKSEALSQKIFSITKNYTDSSLLTKIIRQNGTLLSKEQIQKLIIDLKRQDKLCEFLQHLQRKINEEVMKELIFITNFIWEEYILIQQMNYTFQETIQFAQNWANKYLDRIDEKIMFLNYKYAQTLNNSKISHGQKKQRLIQFKKFITFFATTTSLIIAEYFQNPYNNGAENYFKRELNGIGLCFSNADEYNDKDFDDSQEQHQNYYNKRDKRVKY